MDNELTDEANAAEAPIATAPDQAAGGAELSDELLIEEISIDGMCGVY